MTSDGKKQARTEKSKARMAEKLERKRKFPGAQLLAHNYGNESKAGVNLMLEEGDNCWLKVSKHGNWTPSAGFEDYWEEMTITLTDIQELAELIHALVCRYNALVDEANQHADQCVMTKLNPITNGQ